MDKKHPIVWTKNGPGEIFGHYPLDGRVRFEIDYTMEDLKISYYDLVDDETVVLQFYYKTIQEAKEQAEVLAQLVPVSGSRGKNPDA